MPTSPARARVASLLFPVDGWDIDGALSWAQSNGYSARKVDVTARFIRLRQKEPSTFVRGSFRTIALGDTGVRAIVGRPR